MVCLILRVINKIQFSVSLPSDLVATHSSFYTWTKISHSYETIVQEKIRVYERNPNEHFLGLHPFPTKNALLV